MGEGRQGLLSATWIGEARRFLVSMRGAVFCVRGAILDRSATKPLARTSSAWLSWPFIDRALEWPNCRWEVVMSPRRQSIYLWPSVPNPELSSVRLSPLSIPLIWRTKSGAKSAFTYVPIALSCSGTHFLKRSSNFKYGKPRMISNSFNKQHAKGNPRKLSFDHITVISTARTYSSITNRSGLTRAFRPYIRLWGFDQFSQSYATLKFYSALCVFVCTTQPSRRGSTRAEKTQQPWLLPVMRWLAGWWTLLALQ